MTKFKRFPCVICHVNPKAKTKKIRKFKICLNCYQEINEDKQIRIGSLKHHTKCEICGDDIDHYNSVPTCMMGGCRGKWYRKQKEIDMLKTAIEEINYKEVLGFTVEKIRELGFDVRITTPLTIESASQSFTGVSSK